jgi:hypothetical protein
VSRAISTCSRAGRLDACRWKISMITPVRSRTSAAEVARAMLRSWRGDSSWSMTTTVARGSPVGAGRGSVASSSSSSLDRFLLTGRTLGDDARAAGPGGQLHQLALAEQRRSTEALALLRHLADDLEPERLAQALELLQRRPLFRVSDT